MGNENYGPGGFGDQYDNSKMRSMDRDLHPGGTGAPIKDEYDFNTADYFPPHGEGYRRGNDDLGRDLDRTEWNRKVASLDNFARSELRPDLHPEQESRFRGRGPKGWRRTDERLLEVVCEALSNSLEVDPRRLEVSVEEGCVYLKGKLPTKGMRTVAEDLVLSVPGVMDVFTQIKLDRGH